MSSIIKNFFIYSASALMLRSASIIVAPLTLHLLSPADYGLISLIGSFASIVTILLGFGLRQVVSIEFFHYSGEQQRTLINTILCAYVLLASPVCLCALFGCSLINQHIFAGAATPHLIMIAVIYCFIFFFVELLYQILRYQEKVRLVTTLQTGCALVLIFCNCLLLIWFKAGVYSSIMSYCISYGAVCVWGAYKYCCSQYMPTLCLRTSVKQIPSYLKIGLPFIPTVLCSWVLSSSDRWLLARMASLHDVGLYALADTFGQLYMFIILQPISNAYLPQLMRSFKGSENITATEQKNRTRTIAGMVALTSVISVGYLLCKPIALMLLPSSYHPALAYIWYILMGYVFLTGSYCFSALIQFQKCRWFLSLSLVVPAVSNFVLNILLIPIAGVQGCVVATLIAQIVYCGTTYWYGCRLLKSLATSSYKIHATHECIRE